MLSEMDFSATVMECDDLFPWDITTSGNVIMLSRWGVKIWMHTSEMLFLVLLSKWTRKAARKKGLCTRQPSKDAVDPCLVSGNPHVCILAIVKQKCIRTVVGKVDVELILCLLDQIIGLCRWIYVVSKTITHGALHDCSSWRSEIGYYWTTIERWHQELDVATRWATHSHRAVAGGRRQWRIGFSVAL
jgi:hypothetical protein